MIEPRASVLQLATGLVEGQLAREASAWHVTVQLHASLARMVGANGFDVLLARAFVLAKRSHPVLADFAMRPGGKVEGPSLPAANHAAVKRAVVAVVANFVELLVVLIGEDLAMRLLRELQQHAKEPTR